MGTTLMEQNKYMAEIAKVLASSKDSSMNIVGGGALTRDASGVHSSKEFQKAFTISKVGASKPSSRGRQTHKKA